MRMVQKLPGWPWSKLCYGFLLCGGASSSPSIGEASVYGSVVPFLVIYVYASFAMLYDFLVLCCYAVYALPFVESVSASCVVNALWLWPLWTWWRLMFLL